MRKKRLACVMAAVLALSLTACEKNKRADVWEDRQIIVDDVVYSLPMNFSTLEELGWKVDADKYNVWNYELREGTIQNNTFYTEKYNANTYVAPGYTKEILGLHKEDYIGKVSLDVKVTNYGEQKLNLKDCQISYLYLSHSQERSKEFFDDAPKVVIANDITWGSTGDEVVEVLGKPDSIVDLGEPEACDMYFYEFPDEDGYTELRFKIGYGVCGIMINKHINEPSTSPNDSSDSE